MKTHAKAKRRSSHSRHGSASAAHRSRKPSPVRRSDAAAEMSAYAPLETGRPEQYEGRSPISQEGEEEDRLAALEVPEPDLREIPET